MWHINDSNFEQFTERMGFVEEAGYSRGLLPRDYSVKPFGSIPYAAAPFSESFKLIPENEIQGRIQAMQGKTSRYHYQGKPSEDNQSSLNYCWAFSLAQAVKMVRCASGNGYVNLAAVSLGRDVNWANAGNYCSSAIECAAKFGICEASYVPNQWSRQPKTWKQGWEENALECRVEEWWELGHVNMDREVQTALLLRYPVYCGYNFMSHAVTLDDIMWEGGSPVYHTPNTWDEGQDIILKGRTRRPDEAYVPRVITWRKAA